MNSMTMRKMRTVLTVWLMMACAAAPYLARAHWVALEEWTAIPAAELKELLVLAREIICAKLPKRTRDVLAMAAREKKKLIAQRRKLLAAKGKTR